MPHIDHCATCRFWEELSSGWGRCHADAAKPATTEEQQKYVKGLNLPVLAGLWPETPASGWCGHHGLRH